MLTGVAAAVVAVVNVYGYATHDDTCGSDNSGDDDEMAMAGVGEVAVSVALH